MINGAFDRLQRSFNRQTRFTADASHEMRTPISTILAQSQLALKRPRSDREYQEALEVIARAATRMKGVVDGLLTFARVDANQLSLNIELVDLSGIARDACDLLTTLVEQQRLTLTVNLTPVLVMGDRNRLGEAVVNLISNAVNYNQTGGAIEVTVAEASGLAKLVVADTGYGIPESDQPHVFERFYQVDQARSFVTGRGSGLGLAITKWIAEAHGGTVVLQESQEGSGSVFVFTTKAVGPNALGKKVDR
nr:HAMP domain-containing sensor histidine kinase [Allorhodopirellula heiligendammensis]